MKISKQSILAGMALLGSTSAVAAQTASGSSSTFLPAPIQALFDLLGVGGTDTANFITTKVQTAIYVILGAIILIAVVYSITAGIKYIRSEGDPGKIEEAQKSIKAILMGVAMIFIGILGIILVYVIFGQSITPSGLPQVCISAGSSVGCKQYNSKGIEESTVQWCENVYKAVGIKDQNGVPRFPDGITPADDDAISQIAKNTWGQDPATVLTVSSLDPANPATPKTSYSTVEAVWLCVNPLAGGYLPVTQ